MQKIIARIFKRASLKCCYTAGYNQRPQISTGPALALGVSSLEEYCDVTLEKEIGDDFLDLLNKHSEKGIVFKSVVPITKKVKSIQEMASGFVYFVPTSEQEKIEVVAAKVNEATTLPVTSYVAKKKIYKTKEARDFIKNVSSGVFDASNSDTKVIDEVSPCDGMKGFYVEVANINGTAIRPKELATVLSGFEIGVEKPIKMKTLMS